MSAFPITLVIFIIYNAIVFGIGEEKLAYTLAEVVLPSMANTEGRWKISVSDALVVVGLIALYIEIAKATRTNNATIIDHAASFIVFVFYLLEFLLVEPAGNSTFFILLFITGIDVLAGFTVSITGARRDWGGGHMGGP